MKDLDFDELDKAVSSLMGSPEDKTEPEVTVAVTPSVVATPAPATSTPETPVAPAAAPAKPPAPAARRTSGRFMDVMHPATNKAPAKNASRTGVTIEPRASAEPAATATPPAPAPAETPATSSSDQTWPDPLDMMNKTADSSKEDTSATLSPATNAPKLVTPDPSLEASMKAALSSDTDTPSSPFLADAKVEKRPLGSEPPTGSDTPETDKGEDTDSKKTDEPTPAPDTQPDLPPSPPLPAELSNDLVTIESGESKPGDLKEDDSPREQQDADTAAAAATTATSISQQYKEQPSTGDQDHSAIYDVANYTQPLAHPAKKKSGWLWIVWILVLLAVGVGGAVGLYLMGII